MTQLLSNPTSPKTWLELVEQGDGYLTPEQRQAFEKAINMVVERLDITLGKGNQNQEAPDNFDFARYIEGLEARFIADAEGENELEQDAALTAARVVTHIAEIIQKNA